MRDLMKEFNHNRERLAYRPIFLQNFCDLWATCEDIPIAKLVLLKFFAPLGLKWLDSTNVKDNPEAERSAKCLLRLMRRFAAWEHLVGAGSLLPVVQLHKRLNGLVTRGN
jgi:hypothetical protein